MEWGGDGGESERQREPGLASGRVFLTRLCRDVHVGSTGLNQMPADPPVSSTTGLGIVHEALPSLDHRGPRVLPSGPANTGR